VNEKEYDFTVIGFCDTYRFNSASNTAIIDLKKFKKDISDNVETMYFQTNTTSQELFEQLDDYLMDYSVVLKNVEDFFGKQAQSNDSILKLISDIMYVNLIICFFGIVNNIITDFLNRKKEFAVLISTSMSHTQLIRITNIQMLFVAGYSIIGGLLFSYISTKMLDKIVVYYHLISTGMKYPVMDAIKIFIIAFVLFLIMILVPFCIIKKINIYYYLRRE
jgi:putative ABC transport system permease protein